ncbi:MAG: GNAT family N-acetyltransferase [Bosea sp. (in: a-proteobacteria)]
MSLSEPDLKLALECERRIVNAWPSPSTLLIGDWVVRFANGYSGRANAASPLTIGAELDAATLALIEELYRGDGLPPCIRLTPLVGEATRAAILARGYRVRDASFGMIAPLDTVEPVVAADIEYTPLATEEWIAGVAARQSGAKANAAHLAAIVEKVRMPSAFAALMIAGEPVAYGMSVAERGMAEIGSIVVDPAHRGQGLGRRIVAGLMSWARAKDCHSAYLQVDQRNAVAVGLYKSMGYRELYAYETRIID